MCLLNPVLAVTALEINISDYWSDEELVRFLAERKAEDPVPQNVLVDLDFSAVDPRDFITEGVWYMNWSDDQKPSDSSKYGIKRQAKNGYWESMNTSRIPISTGTAIIGVKIILEFFEGQAPFGMRTGLVMHEYQVEHNDEANLPQDYKSLCKVFLKGDNQISGGSRHNSMHADSPKDTFEAYLQYLAKIEEPKHIVDAKQDISSSKGQNEQNTQSAADDFDIHDVLATEDYIELNDIPHDGTAFPDDVLSLDDLLIPQASTPTSTNSSKQTSAVHDALTLDDLYDLLTPEASASTSANSSKRSMLSEEYFDIDAFLRDDFKDSNTTDGQNKDHKFSIAAPTKLANVVVNPSEQVLVQIHDDHTMMAGRSQQEPLPGGDGYQHSSSEFQQESPTSSCFPSYSNSLQSSIKPPRDRSSSKFGKIIKKYSCFRSL
ncbi:hypothetical protein BS78_K135600 [Paspalum vaginatum]|uniref:NAC domain-containing protein n=1 Tax=Paspalum vaginatum TaxID=158149 RepID=A0A9W8CGZ4_9POAL|nr:hypothetical protein BS78_K135600 [Paspalum vaginatum]KAJ1257262.1 hypothetical protein BS78_K135600 [Paspalum vaginatum]KAJ1257263.1 hypothetical protein BS78_K135600 [Paspalum vaginatum]